MIRAMAEGERRRAVRLAARDWERAGWIDTARRAAIDQRFRDDRVRLGAALRVLVGFFTWFALGSGFGSLMALAQGLRGDQFGVPCLLLGLLCAAGAEIAHGPLRTSGMGADDGMEISAVGALLAAAIVLFHWDRAPSFAGVFLLAAALATLAVWRWGGWFFGLVAGAALFTALAFGPAPRLLWALAGGLLAAALLWLGDRAALVPSQRAAAQAGVVVALAALYAAVNYASVERRLFETHWLSGEGRGGGGAVPLAVSLAASALLPAAVIAAALWRRDRLLLGCGALLAGASLVTLRWYVHLMPLWALLLLCGGALGGLALALRRWLDAGPAQARGGFTAEPLLEGGKRQFLEVAATVAAFTPAARVHAPAQSGFEGGGGHAGGGGATTEF